MKEHLPEIVIGIVGVATTSAAWLMGGRQRTKNEKDDTLTRGADQIVETSNKLLSTLQAMLDEERRHRQSCESKLDEFERKIKELEQRIP
jgi:uncharacterized protein Yka (UPF0111/DUF47 family)